MTEATPTYSVLVLINVRWWNATAFYAVNIARILHKNGHKVIVGCSRNYPAYRMARAYGLKTEDLNFYGFNPLRLVRHFKKLLGLIKREQIQIVNSHRSEDHTFALLAKWLTRVRHVITRGDQRAIRDTCLSRLRYRCCDAVILTCQSIFDQNAPVLGPVQDKLSVIYGSVDEDHFAPDARPECTAARYGIDTGKLTVGIVGRLGPVKDQATFIRAAALVLAENPAVRFVIAGKEAQTPVSALHGLLAELNIAAKVVILPVIGDIAGLMDLFDIGVVTSIGSETISRVLLEYMYRGKAVIGTRVNAIGEIVEPGRNGELIDPGDHVRLAAHLTRLIADTALIGDYGDTSRRIYREKYSETVFYRRYLEVFDRLAPEKENG